MGDVVRMPRAAAMFIIAEAGAKANGLTPRARGLGMAPASVELKGMGGLGFSVG